MHHDHGRWCADRGCDIAIRLCHDRPRLSLRRARVRVCVRGDPGNRAKPECLPAAAGSGEHLRISYPQRPFLALPGPDLGRAQLADAVAARRSHRTYQASPLTLADLATLLHAGYGITGSVRGTPQALRSAPSGGLLYPLELYAACHRVDGLDLALYHYDPLRHGLELVRPLAAPVGGELTPYGEALAESAAVVAVTGVFWRSRFKYGARAYRFTLIEAGHVAQNLLLAAAALHLAAVPVGGFYDRAVDAALGVDGIYEASLYLVPVGHGAG